MSSCVRRGTGTPLLFALLDRIAARDECGGYGQYDVEERWADRTADFERELVGLSPGQLDVLGAFFPSPACRGYVSGDFYEMLLEFVDGDMG